MEFDTATWMKRLGYAALTAAILSSAVYWQESGNNSPADSWAKPEDVSYILIKPSDVHRESLWGDEVSDELQRRALTDLLISPGFSTAPVINYCDDYYYTDYGMYYSNCQTYEYDPYTYYYYYYDNEDYAGPITFTPDPETETPTPEPEEEASSDSSDQSDSDSSGASSDASSDSSEKKKKDSSDSSDRSASDSSGAKSDASSDSSDKKKKDSSDSSDRSDSDSSDAKSDASSDSSEKKKKESSDSSDRSDSDSSEAKSDASSDSSEKKKKDSSDSSGKKDKDSSDSSGKKDKDDEVVSSGTDEIVSGGGSDSSSDSDDTPTPEPESESASMPGLPPLPPALVGASLGDLQSNADQVANLINMPVALMVVSADPKALTDHLTSKKTMKAVAKNGGGADLLMFLSDDDRVKSTLVQLDNVMDGLFAGQELGNIGITETQKGLLDLQNTDADVAYLIAAILAAEDGMNPNLVRFYEMKASSTAGILDASPSGGVMSTAIVDDTIDADDFKKTGGPGDMIYCFKNALTESEYTSLLTGLQDIALEDDLRYSSFASSKRKRAIESDVMSLVKDLGFGKEATDVYDNCIYYPSSDFQRKYAEGVAEAGSLHSSDVTVSLVAALDTEDGGRRRLLKGHAVDTAVFFTARLQKGRCFLCDRRDQSSSETDSSEGSDFKSSSAVSSSQQNFRDSNRYSCPKNSGVKINKETYPITLGQFLFTFPCDTCGWTVSTCPDHKRQWGQYASEQHVLWTFTGSEAVEASKLLGGRTLVNPYKVPNKKVFYQENGRPAKMDQFKKFTATVDGAKIVIPIKS